MRGELLVVELGEFLMACPPDRLARFVDAIGKPHALAIVNARQDCGERASDALEGVVVIV